VNGRQEPDDPLSEGAGAKLGARQSACQKLRLHLLLLLLLLGLCGGVDEIS
jgi:hypothetical protein